MISNKLSVGIVSEGPTDQIVLKSILEEISISNHIDFEIHPIHPKYDAISNTWDRGGWGLVYNWCKETLKIYGSLDSFIKNTQIDILVLQIDADIMYKSYSSCKSITPVQTDYPLPITTPCPAPNGTCTIPCHAIMAIPELLKSWLLSKQLPNNVVLCTPSKSMDAWVVAAMPICIFNKRNKDESTFNKILANLECFNNPETCYEFSDRIGKSPRSYYQYKQTIFNNVKIMLQKCVMAQTFYSSFLNVITEMNNV